jgi:DNA-binding transcriptional MocR family regulator
VPQVAIADYLRQDGYDRHLRRVRKLYRQQSRIMSAMVERFFPAGTRTSAPQGGYVLWVELPERVDSMRLYRAALDSGITVGPGYMFSTRNAFSHFVRLNYSYPWTAQSEAALQRLGELVGEIGQRADKHANMGERA